LVHGVFDRFLFPRRDRKSPFQVRHGTTNVVYVEPERRLCVGTKTKGSDIGNLVRDFFASLQIINVPKNAKKAFVLPGARVDSYNRFRMIDLTER
jgi:hypothetical protein